MTAKILIADDHEIVREGIRRLLTSSRPDWEICGEATDGNQAIEAVKRLKPDVVILDITMPGMSGLEAAPHIAKMNLGCRILIFTMHDSSRLVAEIPGMSAGTCYCSGNRRLPVDLVAAIECLLQGGTFLGDECNA